MRSQLLLGKDMVTVLSIGMAYDTLPDWNWLPVLKIARRVGSEKAEECARTSRAGSVLGALNVKDGIEAISEYKVFLCAVSQRFKKWFCARIW